MLRDKVRPHLTRVLTTPAYFAQSCALRRGVPAINPPGEKAMFCKASLV